MGIQGGNLAPLLSRGRLGVIVVRKILVGQFWAVLGQLGPAFLESLHRAPRLRYARKLTHGDEEEARELVQEATLDVHETIQRKGFAGGSLKAYLFGTIRNRHHVARRRANAAMSIDAHPGQGHEGEDALAAEHPALQLLERRRTIDEADAQHTEALGKVAAAALASHFPLADRVLFRLSAEGYSTRQIQAMTTRNHRTVAYTLNRMRTALQALLRPLIGQL